MEKSWPRAFFRTAVTCVAVLALVQAVLAGGFLSGNFEALEAHSVVGGLTVVAMLLQLVAAVLVWRRSAGPAWTVRVSIIQLLIAVGLMLLGIYRVLTVHVPLAVGLTVGVGFVLVRTWRTVPADIQPSTTVQPRITGAPESGVPTINAGEVR